MVALWRSIEPWTEPENQNTCWTACSRNPACFDHDDVSSFQKRVSGNVHHALPMLLNVLPNRFTDVQTHVVCLFFAVIHRGVVRHSQEMHRGHFQNGQGKMHELSLLSPMVHYERGKEFKISRTSMFHICRLSTSACHCCKTSSIKAAAQCRSC